MENEEGETGIQKILKSWQLAEYIPIFTENKVTLSSLGLLDAAAIKELIPAIGDRVRFQRNLDQWNELTDSLEVCDNSVTKLRHPTSSEYENILGLNLIPNEEPSLSTTTTTTRGDNNNHDDISNVIDISNLTSESTFTPSTAASTSSEVLYTIINEASCSYKYSKLKDLLNSTLEGKGLLNLYAESGLLSSNGRRKICNIIIKHILEKDPMERVSSSTLLQYAQEIAELFKKENMCTYFVPYISNSKLKVRRLAKGKLYDCLQNRKREYREATLNTKNKTQVTDTSVVSVSQNQAPTEINNEDIEWLKNSCDPWDTVTEKWRKTIKVRRAEIFKESNTVESYMKTYPALQKPAGFHLLLLDFENQYPESNDNFKENFPVYKQKIIDLAQKKFTKHPDQASKAMIEEYINAVTEDTDAATATETKSICALMILPLLLGNPTGKAKKKNWRPSKQEARDSFITHVQSEVDLKHAITTRKEKYATLGLTFQPTAFVVGPSINSIKNYYIVVNDVFYVVNSIIEAVDVTFKLFHSLHCEYPTECCTVYAFLQKGFYKMRTKWDKEFTSVNSLMADLDIK